MKTWCLLWVCLSSCTLLTGFYFDTCGNGLVEPSEECDDGNKSNKDGCSDKCSLEPGCGDGIIESGVETCEPPNQGNCNANCQLVCDDNTDCIESPDNPCTVNERCDTTNAICLVDLTSVDDNNACTTDSCDPSNGIEHIPVDIDDNNQCTADSCDPQTGVSHNPVSDGISCDLDSDPNTRDICVSGACAPSSCGDGFVDTGAGESCEPPNQGSCNAQCQLFCNSNQECIAADNNNPCTTNERCNMGTGVCESDLTPTNDNNACTTDSCTAAGVAHDPVPTSDNNLCTLDSCDPSDGNISHIPAENDNNPCTQDSCNVSNGVISNVPVPDGTLCDADSDAATRDICNSASCFRSICGDSVLDGVNTGGVEQCDDGNAVDFDGCSTSCAQDLPVESELEPNDSTNTANIFGPSNHLIGGLISTNTDDDIFRISVPGTISTITVQTYGAQGIGSCNIDTTLEFFNDVGDLLAASDDNSFNNKCSSIAINVAALSQPLIKVTGNNVGAAGANYLLVISFQ